MNPHLERLAKIEFCQKQMRQEQKNLKALQKPYAESIKKLRHLEAAIIKTNRLFKAWEMKRDALVVGNAEPQ